MSKIVMGIKLNERIEDAANFQSILTKYGCNIGTRLGLHVATADSCSPVGLILLEFIDDADDQAKKFEEEVKSVCKADIQKMQF